MGAVAWVVAENDDVFLWRLLSSALVMRFGQHSVVALSAVTFRGVQSVTTRSAFLAELRSRGRLIAVADVV